MSYTYDDAGRSTQLVNLKSDNTTLSSFAYSLDDAGNRIGVTEASGDIVTWSYDNAYQLTREQRSGANAYDITYTYDPVGNRLTKIEGGVTTTYTYDQANQIQTEETPAQITTFTFDANGNTQVMNAGGELTTYTWNIENMCTGIALPNSTVNTFAYDADLIRRQAEDSDGLVKFVNDEEDVLLETDTGGNTQVAYTLDPQLYGNLISQRRSGATSWHQFDALGSTERLTDSSENATDTYLHKAFGISSVLSGSSANRYWWIGRLGYRWEPDAEGYEVRTRRYAPSRGVWLTPDPIRHRINWYSYAWNSPLLFQNPSGLMVIDCEKYRQYCDEATRMGSNYCKGAKANPARFQHLVQYIFRRNADYFSSWGFEHAAAALRHFLSGGGADKRLEWGWIEGHNLAKETKEDICETFCRAAAFDCENTRDRGLHWQIIKDVNLTFRYAAKDRSHIDLYLTLGGFEISGTFDYKETEVTACPSCRMRFRVQWDLWTSREPGPGPGDRYDWTYGAWIPPNKKWWHSFILLCEVPINENWGYCLEVIEKGKHDFWHKSSDITSIRFSCCPGDYWGDRYRECLSECI